MSCFDGATFEVDVQAFVHIKHRPARHSAVGEFFAVFMTECNFAKLGSHTDNGCYHHPKQRRRPAKVYRHSHTRDIARADSARQRRRKCLKMRRITLVMVFVVMSAQSPARLAEVPHLRESQIYRQEHSRPQQRVYKNRMYAHISVEPRQNFDNGLHCLL